MEWISVKDRYPEKSGMYLVWDTEKDDVALFPWLGEPVLWWKNGTITHWMPVPDPPEGVRE